MTSRQGSTQTGPRLARHPWIALVTAALVTLAACGTTVSQAGRRNIESLGEGLGSGPSSVAGLSVRPDTTAAVSAGSAGASAPGQPGSSGASTAGPAGPGGGTAGLPATIAPTAGQAPDVPIKLGFLNTQTSNAAGLGASTGSTISPELIIKALVDAYNAHGGIDGHQIDPVIVETDTGAADWNTVYAAACDTFTEDNHVAAVLGYSFDYVDSFEACLSQAGVPHLDDGYNVGDVRTFEQYPMLFSLANPSWDRNYLTLLEGGVATGQLTRSDKIGALISACPYDQESWHNAALPYIKQAGLDLVDTETYGCASGASDDGTLVAQVESSVLKLHAAGVTKVIGEGPPVIFMAITAQSQGWQPSYYVTSWTGGEALVTSGLMPTAQEVNVHGFGWLPSVDVAATDQPAPDAAAQRCLSMLKSEGLVPVQFNDYFYSYTTCDALFLYQAALQATGGLTQPALVTRAIEGIGTAYQSPVTLGGQTSFGASKHDGPINYRPWDWATHCSCFTYDRTTQSMPA